MVAFIIFSLSCATTKNVRLDDISVKENGKIKILQVDTKSGETIEFSKNQPGRIYNDSITGTDVRITGELDKAYIKQIEKDKKGKILRIMVSIPLSEVEMIKIKESNTGLTFLVIGVIGVAIYLFLNNYVMPKITN